MRPSLGTTRGARRRGYNNLVLRALASPNRQGARRFEPIWDSNASYVPNSEQASFCHCLTSQTTASFASTSTSAVGFREFRVSKGRGVAKCGDVERAGQRGRRREQVRDKERYKERPEKDRQRETGRQGETGRKRERG